MPKDYVVLAADQRRQEDQGGVLPAIRVGWTKEADGGYVQIATVVMAGIDGATEPTESRVDQGLFIDMDRASINQLITKLRLARDEAFGADA